MRARSPAVDRRRRRPGRGRRLVPVHARSNMSGANTVSSRNGTVSAGMALANSQPREEFEGPAYRAGSTLGVHGATRAEGDRSGWGTSMAVTEKPLDIEADIARPSRAGIPLRAFTGVAAAIDALVVTLVAVAFALVYHTWRYHTSGDVPGHFLVGGLIALFFIVPNLVQRQYQVAAFTALPRRLAGPFMIWNMAFLYATATIFLLKAGDDVSRMTVFGTYIFGFVAVLAARTLLARLVVRLMKTGVVAGRRLLLFGVEDEVMRFARLYQPWNHGIQVVGMTTLSRPANHDALTPTERDERLALDLERAVATPPPPPRARSSPTTCL
jgi:hypothetical protein